MIPASTGEGLERIARERAGSVSEHTSSFTPRIGAKQESSAPSGGSGSAVSPGGNPSPWSLIRNRGATRQSGKPVALDIQEQARASGSEPDRMSAVINLIF